MPIFRVHLSTGEKRDISAETPSEAHAIAIRGMKQIEVVKVKVLKEKEKT